MSAQGMMRPMEAEYLKRNPGVTVTSRTLTGQQEIPRGHVFDRWGERYGQMALAGGVLDEGEAQPQFGSPRGTQVTVNRSKGSLITGSQKTKRKRIYGMGGSQGEEKSGTVKKPTLGGE
jgi:hypothetical protein